MAQLGALATTDRPKVLGRLTEGDDREALFDREWHIKLFEDREQHVLEGVADRLRKAGKDPSGVLNVAQDHVLPRDVSTSTALCWKRSSTRSTAAWTPPGRSPR